MRISYDAEVDALCICFADGEVTTRPLADGIAADYDAEATRRESRSSTRRNGWRDPGVLKQVALEGEPGGGRRS